MFSYKKIKIIIFIGFIFFLIFYIHGQIMSKESSLELINKLFNIFSFSKTLLFRKIVGHIIPNMILCLIINLKIKKVKYLMAIGILCSIMFELLQIFGIGRVCSFTDISINFTGFIISIIIIYQIKTYKLLKGDYMNNVNETKENNQKEEIPINIRKVLVEFFNIRKITSIERVKDGHINDTYIIHMPEADYILQRINNNVFNSPFGMMHNIIEVTKYIRKKLIFEGCNPQRSVLNPIDNVYGQKISIVESEYWRVMEYISNSKSNELVVSRKQFSEMGKIVGRFQKLLEGFPLNVLDETIKNFHNPQNRYEYLKKMITFDEFKRVSEVKDEISFFHEYKGLYNIINKKLETNIIPYRVTHNDTKPSNILFDKKTEKGLCLIDLDTVMKGSILFDYGDALRIGAVSAREDEIDLRKVKIKLDYINSFTFSFLKEVKKLITPSETSYLYYGYLLMTIEVAMRFLTDYLSGDVYFRIDYEKHNLDRARNQ